MRWEDVWMRINAHKVRCQHAQVYQEGAASAEGLRKRVAKALQPIVQNRVDVNVSKSHINHLNCELFVDAEALKERRYLTRLVPYEKVLASSASLFNSHWQILSTVSPPNLLVII